MNPKNILKLLTIAFDQPQYNLESIINEDEKAFSFQIESFIKNAIQDSLFVETYSALSFENKNTIPESISIENDGDNFNIDENFYFCATPNEEIDKEKILIVGENNVWNSDQSGFNLEMYIGRTLSFKGELKVEALTQSINSMTHSYTIQSIISASGVLVSPLLIVLQGTDGKFGPRIQKNLFKAENVLVFTSNSGKLTSALVKTWFQEVFLPSSSDKSVLLLDSRSGQNSKLFESFPKSKKLIQIENIPAGTTGMIQPLDVFFFRSWKNFIRYFSGTVVLYNHDINLHHRNNIIKLQSLIHIQFSSPRFKNLIKYAWYKSGYISEKLPEFDNPSVDYCFKKCAAICNLCSTSTVIRCAWSKKSLCMNHFFTDYHICKNFQE
ncbi:hypothetical protein ALC57_18378 [Trachymyrmex cornetzi]|uniref:Transposase Tc5 C-terminal domain-containing protein n=1 Tax=Trachymyrmex cornetzi TaxID=471704 RepID=A0A151IS57_9HYME|nr:hypothetical protein ALC57_18378 [Trachymyrmex cornetzi]